MNLEWENEYEDLDIDPPYEDNHYEAVSKLIRQFDYECVNGCKDEWHGTQCLGCGWSPLPEWQSMTVSELSGCYAIPEQKTSEKIEAIEVVAFGFGILAGFLGL